MSFILDALKKSEAERQLGEIPSLATAGEIPYSQKQKKSWLLPLFLFLLAALVIAWFWREYVYQEAVEKVAATQSEVIIQPAVPKLQEYHPASDLPRVEIKQTPLANYTPPVTAEVFTDGVDLPDTGKVLAVDGIATSNPSEPAAERTEATATDSQADQVIGKANEQQRIERLKQQRAAERAEDEALVAAVEQRISREAQLKTSDNTPVAEPAKSNTVRVNELPNSVRKQIPEISISMQVYSADPDSRFAIINGKRYVESDRIAQNLILAEILRQGVILQYRQYRILID